MLNVRMNIRSRTVRIVLASIVLIGVVGCVEWDKYWKSSPTAPHVVRDTIAPTVRLVSPAGTDSSHSTPVTGSSYRIVVDAQDDVGVARVELTLDDLPPFTLSSPPWETQWDTTPLDEGSLHRVIARAFDAAGNSSTNDTSFAQVFNSGPQVVLSQPLDGARVSGTIVLEAGFPGPVPALERVEFMAGPLTVAVLTEPPWSIMLDTRILAPGEHTITVIALTELGASGVSEAVRIRVNNGTPQVDITFPPDGHQVARLGTLILSGEASDALEGPLSQVTWTSNLDGTIGSGRYLRITHLTVGNHTVTASAVNAWGTAGETSIALEVLAEPTYGYCSVLRPILFVGRGCVTCHTENSPEYDSHWLDLESYVGMMQGGRTVEFPIITPGKPESSLVYNKVSEPVPFIGGVMPPPASFPAVPRGVLDRLYTWILQGAPPDEPQTCAP